MTKLFVLLGLLLALPAAAQDVRQRLFRAEVFALPREAAVALLRRPLDDAAMHAEALKTAGAKLEKLILIHGRLGMRSTSEQTVYFEYPTEFDPPQIVPSLAIVNPGVPKKDPETSEGPVSPFNAGIGTLSTATGTAFETRSLGDTLHLEPVDEGETDYELVSTALVGMEKQGDIPKPVFASRPLKGHARLVSGKPAFIGTYGPTGSKTPETLSLAFLTAHEVSEPKAREKAVPFTYPSLRATFEVVSLEKAAAHALLLETQDGQAVYERAVQHGRRESVLAGRSRSGNRLALWNADEHISPTEFDPPQLPQKLILAHHGLIEDLRAGRQTGLGKPAEVEGGDPNGGFGFITTLSPTAFEMYPLGERIEIEYAEADGVIALNGAFEFTHLNGTTQYGSIRHPNIETRKLVVGVRTEPGKRVLLGTLNRPIDTGVKSENHEDRVWLAFLRFTK